MDLKAEAALEAQRGEDGPGSAVIQFTGAAHFGGGGEVPFFYGEMSDMVRCDLINFLALAGISHTVHYPVFFWETKDR